MCRKIGILSVLFLTLLASTAEAYTYGPGAGYPSMGYPSMGYPGPYTTGTSVNVNVRVNAGAHGSYYPPPVYPAPYYGRPVAYGGYSVGVGVAVGGVRVAVRVSGRRRCCARGFRVAVRVRVRGGCRRFC